MTDADWEPLAPDRLGQHPGEWEPAAAGSALERALANPAPKARGAVRPPPAPPPPPPPPPPAPEPSPAAAALLGDLRARLAATAPKDPLAVQLQRSLDRRARKQRAGRAPFAQQVMPASTAPRTEELPLPVVYEDRDPREDERWFHELPPDEQQRLRAAWQRQRAQLVGMAAGQQRCQWRRCAAALVVFAVTAAVGTHIAWPVTLAAGALCALFWRVRGPDRFADPLVALGCLMVPHAIAAFVHGYAEHLPRMFQDAILLVAFAAIAGFDGEIRRSGGFDAT